MRGYEIHAELAESATDTNDRAVDVEVEQERCGLCFDRRPKSAMRDQPGGGRRCVPECWVPYSEADVDAGVSALHQRLQTLSDAPPQQSIAPLREGQISYINSKTTAAGVEVVPGVSPLRLSRGGAAVQLIIDGGNFASTDTFSYSTGISDSVAPLLSGSSRWTLTLVASGGMVAGEWNMTYNDHTYFKIFSVR